MPLTFFPKPGTVLVCDFSGFTPPEMVKVRPVVVISPRLPNRSQLAAIVPISTTPVRGTPPYAVRLSKNYHPRSPDTDPNWAKCDMVMNLSLARLDRFRVGRGQYIAPRMSKADLDAVRRGVIHALGLGSLLEKKT